MPNVSVAKDAPKTVYFNPWVEPFFAKLSLNNGEVVELQGSGELTQAMVRQITQYQTSIISAEIGELCTSIGMSAFWTCSGLTNVTIGNSVTSISNGAFGYCTGITSITIPDSVTSIGVEAFSGCTGLTSVTIGSGVTSIDQNVFNGCSGLTDIIIPDSVTSIKYNAFSSCKGLTSITIPGSVTSIDDAAFSSCSGLTSIVVDSANTVYDSRNNCNAIINTSTNKLIAGCKNTVIPNTVTSIGYGAFMGCKGLTNITIPSSVTSIGSIAFDYCTGLTNIISLATKAPTIDSYTFLEVKTGGTLRVPSGSTGYDVWMGTGSFYLGSLGWTKVEQ